MNAVKRLCALLVAGAISAGCEARRSEITVPHAEHAPQVEVSREPVFKPVRHDVIGPLKDYIYAQYDIGLQDRRDDLSDLEEKLQSAMLKAGMNSEVVQQIKDGKSAKELEAFFSEQNLVFRRIRIIGQSSSHNYELLRIGSREKKELTVFGIKKELTKVSIAEELITNSYTHEAQKRNLNTAGVVGAHGFGSDWVEYRVEQDKEVARGYYQGEKAIGAELEAEAQNPKTLDKYFGRSKRLNRPFCDRMGTVLHHMGVRDIYKSSSDEADFLSKIRPIWEQESEFHEVMHYIDSFSFEKAVLDKLTSENRSRLALEKSMHLEARAMLAQLYHGNPYKHLGDAFKILGTDEPGLANDHQAAAKLILISFLKEIVNDRRNYSNIDVAEFKPGQEGLLCVQFPLLKEEQIRTLAKSAFDSLYSGRTLRDYMQTRVEQLLKEQR